MTFETIIFLFFAGVLGGALNSVAGGGSFIAFPALLFTGVPPIPANATNITIGTDGTVSVTLPGQQQAQQVGQIQLATFANPGGLQSMGSNLLQETLSSGNPVLGNPGGTEGLGTLQQGYLENSNVDVVTEFVQMVLAQRAYESNSKVVKAADDMYSQVNNMTR